MKENEASCRDVYHIPVMSFYIHNVCNTHPLSFKIILMLPMNILFHSKRL